MLFLYSRLLSLVSSLCHRACEIVLIRHCRSTLNFLYNVFSINSSSYSYINLSEIKYQNTSYIQLCITGLRKVYPYYFTFTTFTKGRWVGERILDVFAREFRAHPAAEYERCIRAGTLTVNYERVDPDYRLKHNDLLANVVHR